MKELVAIQSRLKAPKGQYNSFGKYKYRSCEDILEALKPLLAENKCHLVITDDIVLVGDRFYIKATATITNEKGDKEFANGFARESLVKKGMDDSQITGGTSSYARKYALNGLFCIDDSKDADYTNNGQQNNAVPSQQSNPQQSLNAAMNELANCKSRGEVATVWKKFPQYQTNADFVNKCKEVSAKEKEAKK